MHTESMVTARRAIRGDWGPNPLTADALNARLEADYHKVGIYHREFRQRLRMEVTKVRGDSLLRWLMGFFSY